MALQGSTNSPELQKAAMEFHKLQMILQNQMAESANATQGQNGANM